MRQRIAIIGSGISGLTSAWLLHPQHDITLFEANDYIGGHTNTEDVQAGGRTWPVNTGFIVFNDWTYPNFERLMAALDGVDSEPTRMSFSVKCEQSGLEYCGSTIGTLFAQRRNWFRPRFYRMVRDILRFNRESMELLNSGELPADMTLGEFFQTYGYGDWFVSKYIVPMGAAIWSSGEDDMLRFPALFFIRFFRNHGLLSVRNRPQWRTLVGGSRSYVAPITRTFADRIRLNTPVRSIERPDGDAGEVRITTDSGTEGFDQVILACHSDQALALLKDPTAEEREILGAIPYTDNDVVLHTDASLLPRRQKAWAAWNYHIAEAGRTPVAVTYNMNILQNFDAAPETFCVTLNYTGPIAEDRIIKRFRYSHPVFTPGGMAAQARFHEISNHNRTHYCGAYWFNGFHEDGVNSALRVARDFGIDW
ncbi:FAD-dependent oxidoreductase [Natronospirillum operosum]|uniref:FAD-dependent oxidoreductase n=1 Tax=Natronospirillum operosum TaxID=2759953 RepID=A0A4Z0WG01_9GAMM|nr:FAD-dependent oxidoreductase [Natronospirillum operosum]TGG95538.1 FAD-dependent oxidoreductase [Natronospirillum operosum]